MRDRAPFALAVACVAVASGLALLHAGELRERASAALGRGMPAREAELARGFVLGEDEHVDAATVEDFRRSGLSHLLAVSGQNVALLLLLAAPLLAALGMPLRTRLLWMLGLIAAYVPLAGAGPSIQRAGTMGALAVLATLAGRRASRLYALAVAATLTLALAPGVAADVGWQLSFAAVLGILALAAPLRRALAARGGVGGALADGAAMTIAATLATAPLIAFHFGAISTTTLAANLLALPAVAPAMWLGMLAAAAGQLPGFPVEALNWMAALPLAYIAQVASWCGRPSWAYLELRLSAAGLLAAYLGIAAAAVALPRLARRRRLAALRVGRAPRRRQPPSIPGLGGPGMRARPLHRRARKALAVAAVLGAFALAAFGSGVGGGAAAPVAGLRVTALDVGQGDAILLQPAGAPAVLVDGGPPGGDLAGKLRAAGVERLGIAIVTHAQSDHAGGVEELLGQRHPVARLVGARLGRRLRGVARAAAVPTVRIAAGGRLRSGGLSLDVLWPPRELLVAPLAGTDPNAQAVVLLARWRDFSMLLAADAEAESAPLDPGPVDVLKVAHHGSEDAGLEALLDRTAPELALISVGEGNPFGHPAPATLATLAEHRVPTLRTDRVGSVVLDVAGHSIDVSTGG